jgi:D-xylose transport system permease protein
VIIFSMILGLLIGVFQGSIVAYLKVPAFIVTLGGMYIFKSGVLVRTNGLSLFINKYQVFKNIAQGRLPEIVGFILAIAVAIALFVMVFVGRARKQKYGIQVGPLGLDLVKVVIFSVLIFGYVIIVNRTFEPVIEGNVRGVPILVVLLGVIAVLMSYISTNTRFGRYAYAIGGNREAARLSGINIKKSIFSIFVLMGALLGVSGIALAGYVGAGTTGAGSGYELDVIAACILGGTSTLGGEGTVFGAVVGALIMQSLSNGLQMLNISSYYQPAIKGIVLIAAVLADISMKKKKS